MKSKVDPASLLLGFLAGVVASLVFVLAIINGTVAMVEEQTNTTLWLKATVFSDVYTSILSTLDRAAEEGENAVIPSYLAEPGQVVLNSVMSWTMALDIETIEAELERVQRIIMVTVGLAGGGIVGVLVSLARRGDP